MAIKTKKSNNRTTIIALSILLAVLVSFYVYLKQTDETEITTANTTGANTPRPATGTNREDAKKDTVGIDASGPVYPEPVEPDTTNPGGPIIPYPIVYDEPMVELRYEEDMIDSNQVYGMADQMPEFIGGEEALYEFIKKHVVYPKTALENGIGGTVILEFVVERDSTISNVRVVRMKSNELTDEAMRVLKLTGKKWNPGRENGKPVRVQIHIPIKFKVK